MPSSACIKEDVLATDNNTVGMGDAGIKSAIQGSNVPNSDDAVPSFVSGSMSKACKGLLERPSFPTRRSSDLARARENDRRAEARRGVVGSGSGTDDTPRSEEHTSELQSRLHLVCRPLLA